MSENIKKLKSKVKTAIRNTYIFSYNHSKRKYAEYVPVLAFHWFVKDKYKEAYSQNRWYGDINEFEKQISWLSDIGYHFVSSGEFYSWYMHEIELPEKSVLLTFDDGELSQLQLVEPILKKYQAKGICFVVGKHWLGSNCKKDNYEEDDIEYFTKEMAEKAEMLEFQAHTYDLHFCKDGVPAAEFLSEDEIRKDFEAMKKLGFSFFAAPSGSFGKYYEKYINQYYKLGFAIDEKGNPYATRNSKKWRINRIIVDGKMNMEAFKRYFIKN